MINQKGKAIYLRKIGHSYNEINKKLGISKSTLSSWLCNIKLSEKATRRIERRVSRGILNGLVRRNKMQTVIARERTQGIRKSAQKEVTTFTKRDLKIIGSALYWAEGYKRLKILNGRELTNHSISFTNSDPMMVRSFVDFLRVVMYIPVQKIKVLSRFFPGMNSRKTVRYWSTTTRLPVKNFSKPTYVISRSSKGKRPFNRLPFGTVQIRVLDTQGFYRLMGWIDGVKQALADFSYNS